MKACDSHTRHENIPALPCARDRRMGAAVVAAACGLLLSIGGLFAASASSGRVVKHSAAECRAACQARNLPASCAWLTPAPQHCLQEALRACQRSQLPGPAQCVPPKDLPACGSNHDCPYGALCLDLTCQVLGCGSQNGFADCTAYNRCDGDKCVVAECSAVTANCPRGFHCQPADPPFSDISGTCLPDVPGVGYCTWTGDCIEQGNFNPTCIQGICTRIPRRLGRCQTDPDCVRWCRRGRGAMRPGRCDAAGVCLCPNCADDDQCSQLLPCAQGRVSVCLPSGTCVCRKRPTTTTTTTTSTTTTTTTVPPCFDIFDCDAGQVCCNGTCKPNPYAGQSVCSTLYTPACTLCRTDSDCRCNPSYPIFCDSCGGGDSIFSCVNPCQ